jgi:RNA polymerase sigma-70 factor (ECF subfamily)
MGALAGGASCERQLLDQLIPALRRFLERTIPAADRDDMLQEGLLAFLGALPEFRSESSLVQFSIGVVRRTTRTRRRAARRYGENIARAAGLEFPLTVGVETPEETAAESLRRIELAKLLAELPEKQSRALVLRTVYDLSLAEVAAEAGTSINTVRTRLRLARKRLRVRIAGDVLWRELFGRPQAVPHRK